MDLRRRAPRRVFPALGTAFVVITLCLFMFSPFGHTSQHQPRWASTSGLMRDIRNSTLGVSFNLPCLQYVPRMMPTCIAVRKDLCCRPAIAVRPPRPHGPASRPERHANRVYRWRSGQRRPRQGHPNVFTRHQTPCRCKHRELACAHQRRPRVSHHLSKTVLFPRPLTNLGVKESCSGT